MFKKLLVLLSMLAALAMSAVAFAAPAKSHQQMVIDAARAEVPAAAVFYGYKEEDGEAVLNFRDNDNYLEYEVEVVLATTKVKEVEIKGSNIAGSTMMVKLLRISDKSFWKHIPMQEILSLKPKKKATMYIMT